MYFVVLFDYRLVDPLYFDNVMQNSLSITGQMHKNWCPFVNLIKFHIYNLKFDNQINQPLNLRQA